VIDVDANFVRCWGVPIRRYSVLEGFTVRRLEVSQLWTVSRVDERILRLGGASVAEKEM
jgi:hypothetical protein